MIYLNAANEFCFKGLTEEPSQLQSTVNLSIKLNDLELKQTFRNWASEKEKETKGLWMHCPAKASVISWLCFHIPSPPLWLYFYFSLSCLHHPPSILPPWERSHTPRPSQPRSFRGRKHLLADIFIPQPEVLCTARHELAASVFLSGSKPGSWKTLRAVGLLTKCLCRATSWRTC